MAIEFELKYRATAEDLEKIDKNLQTPATVYRMETTYYDTPSRSLSKRHITLRRRMENDVSVCTLKAPAHQGRAEFELNCEQIEAAIPELCKLSGIPELPTLLAEGIEPVCGARFTRRARLQNLENAQVEIALDQGVLLGGGKEQPFCEVEVELKEGAVGAVVGYTVAMAVVYGLEPEPKSKFKRALELAGE